MGRLGGCAYQAALTKRRAGRASLQPERVTSVLGIDLRRSWTPRRDSRTLQSRRPVQLAEIPIERAQRQMSGFSRKFDEEAIRESERRPSPKCLEGRRHGLRLLERETLMVQEHLNRPSDLSRVAVVDGREHPRGFGEGEHRHQAPDCTNASATAACFGSSRVSNRTRTFVSTARMACPDVLPDTFLQLGHRPRLRSLDPE